MTGEQNLRRLEIIELLQEMIPGCFSPGKGCFAGDAVRREHAEEVRKIVREAGIALQEVQGVAMTYMLTQGFGNRGEHVNKQFADLSAFFGEKS